VARLRRSPKRTTEGEKVATGDARRDAIALVIAYAKQETLEPLKVLLRFVIFGTLGSFAIALGTVLLLVAVLRILQTETGAFHGNLSWLPYLIVLAIAVVIMIAAGLRIVAGPAARRTPKKTSD
jgi:hypothetical protein